jgi:hypothetical protein
MQKILSDSEKLDAQIFSLIHGNGGELIDAAVAYVQSQAYQQARTELTTKEFNNLRNIANAAIAEKNHSLQKGNTEEAANAAAMELCKRFLSA